MTLSAERAVLGTAMEYADSIEGLADRLASRDFYDLRHGTIYANITGAWGANQPTDVVAIAHRLDADGQLARIGGLPYLHTLIAAALPPALVGHHAAIVAQQSRVRDDAADASRLSQAVGDEQRFSAVLAEITQRHSSRMPAVATGTVRHGWRSVDLTDVLAGRYESPRPTVGRRDDGMGLFYPGRVHSIASESEAGKTWLALIAVREELDAGNAAMYVDFEDDEGGVVGRLLALGAKPSDIAARFAYIRPDEPISMLTNAADLEGALGDLRPTLAVLDGVTEAMALHGLELKDNSDVARFGKLLPRAIAAHGPATVALDHVVKNPEGRGRYAIGGVHKLNGINGAAFVLENRQPFGIGRAGKSTVYVAKDRPGQLRRNALPASDGLFWLTTMEINSHDESFVETSLHSPVHSEERPRPTTLMRKVCEALATAGQPLTKQGIEDRVTGKAQFIRQALATLVDEGFITVTPGPRGSHLHTLVRQFGGDAE